MSTIDEVEVAGKNMAAVLNAVRATDRFNENNFPKVQEELEAICNATSQVSIWDKTDMLISYLKDHFINNDRTKINPELTRLLMTGFYQTSHLELLFASFRYNQSFIKDLENYICRYLQQRMEIF
ncbi:MAG: hypothetical protein ABIP79_11315 [Chitinophagaceae bacterium]